MELHLAISPCPNDTFIFDALIHNKIDTQGLKFIPHYHDVEQLNNAAMDNKYDVTKLSYFAFTKLQEKYQLLSSGGALGHGCGPLLISKYEDIELNENTKVAIPGKNTTANFLLSLAYPQLINKTEILFSEIEEKVLSEEFDLGLIIHESRFTYEKKGLKKIKDLGEYWEQKTNSPIPLGCIVMKKRFNSEIINKVENLISESVKYAFANPDSSMAYVKQYAQDMNDDVIKSHIKLYVNEYSMDLGEKGKKAVAEFLNFSNK